jgi:hypothetical protein
LIARSAAPLAATLLVLSFAVSLDASATELSTKTIPLPMYSTVPNEGSTYGIMPVFFRTENTAGFTDVGEGTGAVYSIIAPSLSWNSQAGVTGSFRYYRYLDPMRSWSLVMSASTHINRTIWWTYDNITRVPQAQTHDAVVMVRRNLFFRFFGLGPDTHSSGESSYTRTTATINDRWGYNFTRSLNLGGYAELRGDRPEEHPIFGLPATQVAYPTAPGINGAAMARTGATLRFDTRKDGDYSLAGLASELAFYIAYGIGGGGFFEQLTWHSRAIIPETDFLQTAVRLYWTQEWGGSNVPFYYRPSLGGEWMLRGYPDDRFIAFGAWTAEVEQRIRFLQLHLFNVISDWRVDPFLAVGQVYDNFDLFSHVRVTGGIGLRAWVHPNVVGRIDLAVSDDGFHAYVMLGYPF